MEACNSFAVVIEVVASFNPGVNVTTVSSTLFTFNA